MTIKMNLTPIGIVKNGIRESRGHYWQDVISEIIVNEDLKEALDRIEEFSHIIVLYWMHKMPQSRRLVMKVHPRKQKSLPLVGVFSTHSPARPNNILVTVVELLSREKNVLKVTGLDALDGSPVLDIKPYIQYQENIKNIRHPDWIKQIHSDYTDNDSPDIGIKGSKGS